MPLSIINVVSTVTVEPLGQTVTLTVPQPVVSLVPRVADVVTVGIQGPPGAAGIPEDEMTYAKRVDFVGSTLLYRAEAAVGSAEGDAVWRVRRITFAGDGDVTEEWADGDALFNQTWDGRAGYTYS